MKAFNGFESKRSGGGRETLPAGGYVCTIQGARVEEFSWGSRLVLAIDVAEGEYAGIWKRDYDSNDREDKKWRGTFRVSIPKDDGSEQDAWTKRAFNNMIWSVEQSNPGYTWNWDEKTLKGKKIGVLYRNREWEMNGSTGWTTEAAGSDSVGNIREGKFKMLKDNPLKNRTAPAVTDAVDDESELPF